MPRVIVNGDAPLGIVVMIIQSVAPVCPAAPFFAVVGSATHVLLRAGNFFAAAVNSAGVLMLAKFFCVGKDAFNKAVMRIPAVNFAPATRQKIA